MIQYLLKSQIKYPQNIDILKQIRVLEKDKTNTELLMKYGY